MTKKTGRQDVEAPTKEAQVSKKDAKKDPFRSVFKIGSKEEMLKLLNELAYAYTSRGWLFSQIQQYVWNGWKHLLSAEDYEPDPEWGKPNHEKAFVLKTEAPNTD